MSNTERPFPQPTAATRDYWAAAREGRLLVQRCGNCGVTQFYPREFCVACLSDDTRWLESSGRGRVYTYTVCHMPGNPAMANRTPYVIAMVDLEEGVRTMGEILDCAPGEVRVGDAVEVVFEQLSGEISLPQFRLGKEV